MLAGIELSIPAKSFVGILGHNGSGKTTLLKTVLGLVGCLKGRIVRHGSPSFGYVPQKESLDPSFPVTAYDVAAMGRDRKFDLFARLRLQRDPLVERCLASCGVSALAAEPYGDLSGGQRQRVLIARALAAEPDVLALDEPLAGVDVTTQRSLIKLLGELKAERQLTVLMVSHGVRAVRELFTHAAWCEDGRVVFGPAEQVLAQGRARETFESEL